MYVNLEAQCQVYHEHVIKASNDSGNDDINVGVDY